MIDWAGGELDDDVTLLVAQYEPAQYEPARYEPAQYEPADGR